MLRALGYTWTATGGSPGAYYVDQVFPQVALGCAVHAAGAHPCCDECRVMRQLEEHLAPAGGLSALVVVFCVTRRSAPRSAGGCVVERVEHVLRLVDCPDAQCEDALLRGVHPDFGRLCEHQLARFIARHALDRLARAPPGAEAARSMAAAPLAPQTLGVVSCDLMRPGIGAWAQGDGAPRIAAALPGYSPPFADHQCTEGGAVELASGKLTVVLASVAALVFACDGCERTVVLPLHDIAGSAPHGYVRVGPLQAGRPLRTMVRTAGAKTRRAPRRVAVVNARKNSAFGPHSEMRTSALSLDRLHPPPQRAPPAPPPGWPSFLQRYVVAERPQAAPRDAAHMQAAAERMPWHSARAPPHQLYGLSALLRSGALQAFLDLTQQQGSARAQAFALRTDAEALQDHLFALYLGFTPALQELHDAAADLVWEAGWFCCGDAGAARRARLAACLQRVATQHEALAPGAAPPAGALGDLSAVLRGVLQREILGDCAVSMFGGGALVMDLGDADALEPLAVARASIGTLNGELRARGLHPGAAHERHDALLRSVLEADVQRNLFARVRAAWPLLARLRRAALLPAGAPDPPGALGALRAFVRASAAHQAAGARRLLLAPAGVAERAAFAQTAAGFLRTLAAAAAETP